MNILHVNVADVARGAAKAAWRLHEAQLQAGHASRLLVGYPVQNRPDVEGFPRRDGRWQGRWFRFVRLVERHSGLQYLWQPWKRRLLVHPFVTGADVVNLHNVQSGYFSHTVLPELTAAKPVVWTLHDLWGLTGHCGFPSQFGCERWLTGCGRCPALWDHPPISIDTTALLWRVKSSVYRRSALSLVVPSAWMADMVRRSPLLGRFELHCIPHGLDTSRFQPLPKVLARRALGLPEAARIVLFSAFDLAQERKGAAYLFQALQRLYDEGRRDLLLVTMGHEHGSLGGEYSFPVHSLGHQRSDEDLARCFAAADVYAGPSLSEAFGLVFLEAMACGTPVVAFAEAAVPEVVRHRETGFLARGRDVEDLTRGLRLILDDAALRGTWGRQARELVEREYTLDLMAQRYESVYRGAIAGRGRPRRVPGPDASEASAEPARELPRTPQRHRRAELAYLLDRGLAPGLDPAQTLLVSGFWRSGTTWIQEALREILHAKTLFEPLDPLLAETRDVCVAHGVADRSHEFLRLFLPYGRDGRLSGPLRALFRLALSSRLPGSWPRRFRRGMRESLRRRLVVKFVNAQLCLRAAQDTFGMPVVHVHRDPRAVVASVNRTRWHWVFDSLSLKQQLLDVPDGRADYFGRYREDIERWDRCDRTVRVAAYWALTERYLEDSYAGYAGRFVAVRYETLLRRRELAFGALLDGLHLAANPGFRVRAEDSTTTSGGRRGGTVRDRESGWRNELGRDEVAAIEGVVGRLGLEDRLKDPAA